MNSDLVIPLKPLAFRTMRHVIAPLAVVALFLATGCEDRQNMRAVPDRAGHATGPDSRMGDMANAPVAGKSEQWYTMQDKDTLTSVAKKFGVELEWLITRNQITPEKKKTVGAGYNLIVPRK